MALQQWPHEPLNLVCDSGYTVYTLLHINQALLKGSVDPPLLSLFLTLQTLLDKREHILLLIRIPIQAFLVLCPKAMPELTL